MPNPGFKHHATLTDAFWFHVVPGEKKECWEWNGYIGDRGYGQMKFKSKTLLAHRVSWAIHFGDIQDDLFVCHTCDNPKCVNPNHLFVGEPADNSADMTTKERQARGQRVGKAKLTDSNVVAIKEAQARGHTDTEIANIFGIARTTVRDIRSGRTWKHVTLRRRPETQP